jgi:excisionase family DNA binding protein
LIIPDDIAERAVAFADQYFDLRGLSAYSSLAVPTLRDYIRAGHLPCFKVKGKILVKRSEFDQWLERRHRYSKTDDLKRLANEALSSLKSAKRISSPRVNGGNNLK